MDYTTAFIATNGKIRNQTEPELVELFGMNDLKWVYTVESKDVTALSLNINSTINYYFTHMNPSLLKEYNPAGRVPSTTTTQLFDDKWVSYTIEWKFRLKE